MDALSMGEMIASWMWWGGGLGIVVVAALLTGSFLRYALRTSLLDHPNARSSHEVPTPRGGGVAVVATFLGCVVALWGRDYIPLSTMLMFLVGGGGVAFVGLLDDYYHLSARLRLTVHIAAAVWVVLLLPQLPFLQISPAIPWLSTLVMMGTVLGLVWLLNLYNFMDGIDALAAQETIVVAVAAAVIIGLHGGEGGQVILLLSLAAATLGFLVWNLPPAKIFMGDACSGFLGFSLGGLVLISTNSGAISLCSWLILLTLFIVDATITLLRRVLRGQIFYEAHRSHAYQILARRYRSHKKVTFYVFLFNVFWCVPLAVLVSYFPGRELSITGLAFLLPTILVFVVGAGTTNS